MSRAKVRGGLRVHPEPRQITDEEVRSVERCRICGLRFHLELQAA